MTVTSPSSLSTVAVTPLATSSPSPSGTIGPTATLPPIATIFAHPTEPVYVPGRGFAPDAQRILDLASLQISLERYRRAKGVYPATLDALFPTYAPVANGKMLAHQPRDPATNQPYDYKPSADGHTYQLVATLESHATYSVGPIALPPSQP